MKSKYFVRGLGVGVLVTAILFAGISMIRSSREDDVSNNGSNGENVATEAPVKKSEEPDNSQAPSETEAATVQPDTTAAPTEVVGDGNEASNTSATATMSPVAATEAPAQSGQGTGSAGSNVSQSSGNASASSIVDVTIKSGVSSKAVASMLEEKGLVDDADEFNNYIVSRGYDEKINAGTYQIKKGVTYEQIARTITALSK